MVNQENVRATLKRVLAERGESYAAMSRMIGRNSAYIQQFIMRGTPERLEESDRRLIADHLGITEAELGGLPLPSIAAVPRLGVEASAGRGIAVGGERVLGAYSFDRAWLKRVSSGRAEALSIIRVTGDSMSPTLADGDDVLVDRSDAGERLRDGIYVLRRDEDLMVKRVALEQQLGTFSVISDNPAYPRWPTCTFEMIAVIGRVIWVGRRLS